MGRRKKEGVGVWRGSRHGTKRNAPPWKD
jgi:hypothetical protein